MSNLEVLEDWAPEDYESRRDFTALFIGRLSAVVDSDLWADLAAAARGDVDSRRA